MATGNLKTAVEAAGIDWDDFVENNLPDIVKLLTGSTTSFPMDYDLSDYPGINNTQVDTAVAADETDIANTSNIGITNLENWVNARESFYSEALQTNTTTTYSEALNVTTKSLPAGKYRITISYGWNADTTTGDFWSRLFLDGSDITGIGGRMHRQEPKDSAGSTSSVAGEGLTGTGTNQKHSFCMSWEKDFATAGTHTFLLDFRPSSADIETGIWNICLYIEKIDYP